MIIMVRRFTIIVLSAALFAMAFSAAVEHGSRMPRLQASSMAICHPASLTCSVAL